MTDQPPKTILVVEDDAAARTALAAVLLESGYAVAPAQNGRVALDLLAAGLPAELILLDMLMPELDGWHVLGRLRETPHATVPVVMMTGSVLSREWAAEHGCAGFLKKPIDEAELLVEIGQVLNPAEQSRSA
ncbi:MAG TPA: response regulator [Gemmataceae bacterium]|jgi:CheY-like chemotaxis protein